MKKLWLVIILIALITAAFWWLMQPEPASPVKITAVATPTPTKIDAVKPTPAPIAAPVMPPLVKPAPTPQPVAADPAKDGVQAELNAVIDDMATMLQSGDMAGMVGKYTPPEDQNRPSNNLTPEQRAARIQGVQQVLADPRMQPLFEAQAQALQSLKDQTPELNAAGDQATYQMTMPAVTLPRPANMPNMPETTIPERRQAVIFQKIDGKWYLKSQ